jgi:hypothetical protein
MGRERVSVGLNAEEQVYKLNIKSKEEYSALRLDLKGWPVSWLDPSQETVSAITSCNILDAALAWHWGTHKLALRVDSGPGGVTSSKPSLRQ